MEDGAQLGPHDLLEALLELHESAPELGEQEIIQAGLEAAVALTKSQIGYFHFVNEDQETIELVTWSRGTLALCEAVYERHYPISSAGMWADCARHRRPFVHNDYPSMPNRAGYPEGHAHLLRHLGVPVVDGDLVRVLTGVGNKVEPYDEGDIAVLQRIAETVWRLVAKRREQDRLTDTCELMREAQRLALLCAWECDPEDDRVSVDEVFAEMVGIDVAALPRTYEAFLAYLSEDTRAELRAASSAFMETVFSFHGETVGPHGAFPVLVRGHVVPRPRGQSMIVRGVLQDLREQAAFERIRDKALHDPLTGLGNRNALAEYRSVREGRGRRAAERQVAVLYLDLDGFKAINDELGHPAGDHVLREVGRRLEQHTRTSDLVLRFGGDEFVLVQHGVRHPDDALALAEKLTHAITKPLEVAGQRREVGVTIGIALAEGEHIDVDALIDQADAALYEAKREAKGTCNLARLDSSGAPTEPEDP